MSKFITTPLAKDLPENWTDTQYVSPNGTEVGLSEKHGYNYLMKQVNNAQKAAKELDNGLSCMVGVNILDNAYFADVQSRILPKYAIKGASYYEDAAFTKIVRSLDQACPLTEVTEAYGSFKSGTKTLYVKPANIRDGYAADGKEQYILSRWKGHQVIAEKATNGLILRASPSGTNEMNGYLRQYFVTPSKLANKTVTISVLVNSVSASGAYMELVKETGIGASYPSRLIYKELTVGMNVITLKVSQYAGDADYPYLNLQIVTPINGSIEIAALKVELGPYQTLAHQDADGAWILNEIPNKGLETVKCNCAPVELGGIGMIVAPEDIGAASTANTFAVAEVM